jgi:hypothetical protein
MHSSIANGDNSQEPDGPRNHDSSAFQPGGCAWGWQNFIATAFHTAAADADTLDFSCEGDACSSSYRGA